MRSFLFPGEIFRRYQSATYECNRKNYMIDESYAVYILAVRQYLGLGGLLQFIPGTNANLARKYLTQKLNAYIDSGTITTISDRTVANNYFHLHNINKFLSYLSNRKDSLKSTISEPSTDTISKIFRRIIHMPIFSLSNNVFNKSTIVHVLDCLNPFENIKHLSHCLLRILFKMIDLGASGKNSSLPRKLLKGLIAIPFFILDTAIDAVSLTVSALTFPARQLFSHFANSFKQAYDYRNKGIVIDTAENFKKIRVLRKEVKAHDSSYEKISKTTTKSIYIGVKKEQLYNTQHRSLDPQMPIAIVRSTEQKAQNTRKLAGLAKNGIFDEKTMTYQFDDRTIDEATSQYTMITPSR